MRIAICTRLRIPIFICNRANSSSFASCGMRQLCADAEDVALVWQNEHRHAVKTTRIRAQKVINTRWEGESGRPSWFVSLKFLSSKQTKKRHISHLQSDHLGNLYPLIQIFSHLLETSTLTSTQVKCHWGTYWGVDGRHFPEVQPRMRKKTYSTGREKSAGPGESRIHPDVSQWSQRRHGTEICHWSWVPSTPTFDIHKNFYPIVFLILVFFLHPKKLLDKWVKEKHNK